MDNFAHLRILFGSYNAMYSQCIFHFFIPILANLPLKLASLLADYDRIFNELRNLVQSLVEERNELKKKVEDLEAALERRSIELTNSADDSTSDSSCCDPSFLDMFEQNTKP